MILVDANVWIFFLDADLPEHPKVRARLERWLVEEEALLPAVVSLEVIHYLSRQMTSQLEHGIQAFLGLAGRRVPIEETTVRDAATILLEHRAARIGGRDAAILAVARREGAQLVTADRALARVARSYGLKVSDPTR